MEEDAAVSVSEAALTEAPKGEVTMGAHWLLALLLLGSEEKAIKADDFRPTAVGAPQVSFLVPRCSLETTTEGGHWQRLFLNCGAGPHLLSEPSSLMWHVRIRTPEQALELVRLFTTPPRACQTVPLPHWVEINSHGTSEPNADRDSWLALDQATYDRVCPKPSVRELGGGTSKRFLVTRCLVGVDEGDANLYSVEEHVSENGETETMRKAMVLPNARARIGSCDPAAPPQ